MDHPLRKRMRQQIIKRFEVELAFTFLVVAWGINYVIIKHILSQMNVMAFVLARFIVLTLFSLLLLWWKEKDFSIEKGDFKQFFLAGFISYFCYQILFVGGVNYSSPYSSALLSSLTPIFSALFLSMLKIEKPSRLQWVGIFVAFAGTFIFLWDKVSKYSFSPASLGDLLIICSAAVFALFGIVSQPLFKKYSSVKVMAVGIFIGTSLILPVSVPSVLAQDWTEIKLLTWILVIYTALVPIYACYTVWNWSIARVGLAKTSLVTYAIPIIAGVFAYFLMNEEFTSVKVIGTIVVIGGMFIARKY